MVLFVVRKSKVFMQQTKTSAVTGIEPCIRDIMAGIYGVKTDLIAVTDMNEVHFEIKHRKPKVVIFEQPWVLASDIKLLEKMHGCKCYVHWHSKMPFIAMESGLTQFLSEYDEEGIESIFNHSDMQKTMEKVYETKCHYLPNAYNRKMYEPKMYDPTKEYIDIGCFGSVRLLKNNLTQAFAAIAYARGEGKKLRFHINSNRSEGPGATSLISNLYRLFFDRKDCELVKHPWMEPGDFVEMLRGLDLGMQLSLTESFNIVTADYIAAGLPIVVSREIDWVHPKSITSNDSIEVITLAMHNALREGWVIESNQESLKRYTEESSLRWSLFLNEAVKNSTTRQ